MSDYTYTSFNVTVKGLRPIIKKYENLIRGVEVDSEKGLRDLVTYVKGLISANFESEGRRRGGQWAHLKPDTIKRKIHLVVYGAGAERIIFFFFQAEDGIRDLYVTGVQTCAFP